MRKNILLLGLVFILLSGFASATTDDAWLYYTFDDDDTVSTHPQDVSGNSRHGINIGGTTTGVSAVLNEGYDLDDSDDRIQLTTAFSKSATGSLCMGLNFDTTDEHFLTLSSESITNKNVLYCYMAVGVINCGFRPADSLKDWEFSLNRAALSASTDYHFCITQDGTAPKAYIDGGLEAITFSTDIDKTKWLDDITGTIDNAFFGYYSIYYGGIIDELAYYERELSLSEVQELDNSGAYYNPYDSETPTNYFQLSAKNANNNISIDSFSATFTNSSGDYTNSTTDGTLEFIVNDNSNYEVFVNASGFAYYYINLSYLNNTNTETVYLDKTNSIDISIYDQNSGDLINESVEITFINASGQFQRTTINGTYYITELAVGHWSVEFDSDNYTDTSYDLTVSQRSTQTLNAYMLSNDDTRQTILQALDADTNDIIEGASITIKRILNDVWTVVTVLQTDITGKTRFTYEEETEYQFIISTTNYEDKSFSLNPILFSTYTIYLDPDTEVIYDNDYASINIYWTPKYYRDEITENITFTFSSPWGNFDEYGFNATFDSTVLQKNGNNAYGEELTGTLNLGGADFGDSNKTNASNEKFI